jgi:tRNA(fMet)-specific endonuclease VapC
MYFLDTNILIYASEGNRAILKKIIANAEITATSALCFSEFERGAILKPTLINRTEKLLNTIPVFPFDKAAALLYASLFKELSYHRGRDMDRLIAAHAMSLDAILVTANTNDFSDIKNLKTENWLLDTL